MTSYRDEKHLSDPSHAAKADAHLAQDPQELWRSTYQLICRAEHAERKASERERFQEVNALLKTHLYDLVHLDVKGRLECCDGAHGMNRVTHEELALHDHGCPARALSAKEVELLGEMLQIVYSDHLEDIEDRHVSALARFYGVSKNRVDRAERRGGSRG